MSNKQKSTGPLTAHIKSLIPADIPETYAVKPLFKSIAGEEKIRGGVLAFRAFLYQLLDRLTADGDLYSVSAGEDGEELKTHMSLPLDHPFLSKINSVLIDIGFYGELSADGGSIVIADWQNLTAQRQSGRLISPKMTVPKLLEVLRYLADTGVKIEGVDLKQKKPDMSDAGLITFSHPSIMPVGLKAMATAQVEFRTNNNEDILLLCDYESLMNEEPELLTTLRHYLPPLPEGAQRFIQALHQHSLSLGLTCAVEKKGLSVRFLYARKSRIIWMFSNTFNFGSCIFIKAKRTERYADAIETFHPALHAKIAAGYGCYRKTGGTRCNGNCQGFRFPADDSLTAISRDMQTWVEKETM